MATGRRRETEKKKRKFQSISKNPKSDLKEAEAENVGFSECSGLLSEGSSALDKKVAPRKIPDRTTGDGGCDWFGGWTWHTRVLANPWTTARTRCGDRGLNSAVLLSDRLAQVPCQLHQTAPSCGCSQLGIVNRFRSLTPDHVVGHGFACRFGQSIPGGVRSPFVRTFTTLQSSFSFENRWPKESEMNIDSPK